ncbi:TPA: type III-B CRISPR module-associated Cmr3 family protein [Streptococcus suis]
MDTKWYKISLTPLEYYYLGSEQNFRRDKSLYFAESEQVPSQTTVLGMLRYYMLKCARDSSGENLLGFDDAKKAERDQLIGSRSFDFSSSQPQDFGKLKCLTGVQIVNQDGHVLLKRPYNLVCDDNGPVRTEAGSLKTYLLDKDSGDKPYFVDFSTKNNSRGQGYLEMIPSQKEVVLKDEDDLFSRTIRTRVNKEKRQETGGKNDDAFFKVEMYRLRPGYHFQFFTELEENVELDRSDIVFLGGYKSAFKLDVEPVSDSAVTDFYGGIEQTLNQAIETETGFYYALSETYWDGTAGFDFSVNQKRYFRNLETQYNQQRYRKRKRLGVLYDRASVFYSDGELVADHANSSQIGLNKLIRIEGRSKD